MDLANLKQLALADPNWFASETVLKLLAFVEAYDRWVNDPDLCEPDLDFHPIVEARKALDEET